MSKLFQVFGFNVCCVTASYPFPGQLHADIVTLTIKARFSYQVFLSTYLPLVPGPGGSQSFLIHNATLCLSVTMNVSTVIKPHYTF